MWAIKHRISLKITSQRKPLPFQALRWHTGVFCVFLAQAGGWVTDRQSRAMDCASGLLIVDQTSVQGVFTPQ